MDVDCIELIELANRLCLPRLLALTEQHVSQELSSADESTITEELLDDVIMLLEPAQVGFHKAFCFFGLYYKG